MSQKGWHVIAMPAARLYNGDAALPLREQWNSVEIRRIWRPSLRQSSNFGRVLNALFMLLAWTWQAVFSRRAGREVVVVGTDPILSILVAIPWRLFRPCSRIVHWCHDVHPEAAIAEGSLRESSLVVRWLKGLLKFAYHRCDAIVDLGPCMRDLLRKYQSTTAAGDSPATKPIVDTITPWALVEPDRIYPPSAETHKELFGECNLGCLYSGNLGRAHDFEMFLTLARAARTSGIGFCFAGRGARMQALKDSVTPGDKNVSFAGFADEAQLNARLQAGDVHLVSLQESWTGTVVPSKFFGSLAIGRPVLFVGSADCAIAKWIQQYEVGWHLTSANLSTILTELTHLSEDASRRDALNLHCQNTYRTHFSKARQLRTWHELFEQLLPNRLRPET